MATSNDLKKQLAGKLESRAGVNEGEPVLSQIGDILDDALLEHQPGNLEQDFTQLALPEYELVLLLAWARVCDARASLSAPQQSLKGVGGGFGSDRDTPFYKNQKLAETIRKRYTELRSRLSEDAGANNPSGDITVGDLVRVDEQGDITVPLSVAPSLPAPTLSVGTIVGQAAGLADLGSVILSWSARQYAGFYGLKLFQSPTAGIYQTWRVDQNSTVPQISADAEMLMETTDNVKRGSKPTGLIAGTYYFLLVQEDKNGRFVYSNEVAVTIPA